jgi:NAD(P)-dependent dehydrogenase (short-subunit alcohol dehydrogenase family)
MFRTRYRLDGRTVAITGSTGGLGAALAEEARRRGANLALLDLDGAAAAAQAAGLGETRMTRGWGADVRDLDSLQSALNAAAAHFGRLDVVIAGAGIDTMAPMATIDPAAFERVIDVNLNGVWRTFRAALPHVQRQRGYLLAISSLAAFAHSPLQASYTASKAGVWAMCDSIRLELRHLGVAVGSAHPTFFRTPLMDDVVADPAGRMLWDGNEKGVFKMAPIETVVEDIFDGIDRRARRIVTPRSLRPVAAMPGLMGRAIELIGYRGDTIPRATELASRTGWHQERGRERSVSP